MPGPVDDRLAHASLRASLWCQVGKPAPQRVSPSNPARTLVTSLPIQSDRLRK
jgi:hypothetical protein